MELVIAEKPSVARDLARVLGVPASGRHMFEGERYVITWCIGHLVELEEPAAYNPAWKAWRLDRLPMLPEQFKLRGAKHALPQLQVVEKLLRERFETVINACDAGREGELIFRYVYQHAKSRLAVRRLWISSLTDDAIRRGFAALKPGRDYEALADAARSRSEADWLVGMNATRAITARGREAGHDALYSIGRVQTPTLAMIVERERAIRAFVPRDYWEVTAALRTAEGGAFAARWRHDKSTRLGAAALADEVVARDTAVAVRSGPAAGRTLEGPVVERVRSRTVKEPPPQLFDLTTLQRTANRRFGFSAQRTLELAQALYERHKVITYPRTDSRHLSADVAAELVPAFTALAEVPVYAPFAQPLLDQPPRPNRRIVDDSKVSDHHAIIPTGKRVNLGALDRDESRLFDLIARRFLGAFFPDAEIAVTEAWIRVGPPVGTIPTGVADKDRITSVLPPMPDRYLARGRVRLIAGWQDVAGISAEGPRRAPESGDEDDDREPTALLPPLVEGASLTGTFASVAKQTSPPPRYTEATLLGAMESAGKAIDDETLRAAMKDTGLGTPATRASIIETLLRRTYIEREQKWLVPTPTGIGLISAIPVPSLASAELTGGWEARLAAIARGADTRVAFMADIARYVTEIVDAIRGASAPGMPPPSGGSSASAHPPRAPSSGGSSSLSSGPRGPRPTTVGLAPPNRAWSVGAPLPNGGDPSRVVELPSPGSARASVPGGVSGPGKKVHRDPARTAGWARLHAAKPKPPKKARTVAPKMAKGASPTTDALPCPRCKRGALITGGRGWGCSRWTQGCGFVIWFETAGRRLTPTQLRDLVTKGKTRKGEFAGGEGRLVLDPGITGGARFERG